MRDLRNSNWSGIAGSHAGDLFVPECVPADRRVLRADARDVSPVVLVRAIGSSNRGQGLGAALRTRLETEAWPSFGACYRPVTVSQRSNRWRTRRHELRLTARQSSNPRQLKELHRVPYLRQGKTLSYQITV